ncbi:amidase family protein [Nocardia sp. NPDC057668]|uniref:amidase family protein n=1 Tax=Nocardia sp. NPDC057668 TaxID=3346202 RepID=UPI00367067AA
MIELSTTSAGQVSDLLAAGAVSSVELVQQVLARMEQVNPLVNAVANTRAEQALREAAASDEMRARGRTAGPLHGVPVTVKECFHAAGLPSSWGNPAFANAVVDADSAVVARLRAAGAILVGNTNLAFMLGDFGQCANEVYGVTANPWDRTRSPGGSSGGSAAAVAAGLSFLEYGSDVAGSIRIPAAFCGVYGLRPTVGTTPLSGFGLPGPTGPISELSYPISVGPMARSASDLRLALRVTAGPEGSAAHAYRWSLAPSRRERLADFRVGVVLDDPGCPVNDDLAEPLSVLVERLGTAGATIVHGWPPGIDPAAVYRAFGGHLEAFLAFQTGTGSLGDLVQHEQVRMAARAAWDRHFADIDVLVCPVNFTAAIPLDDLPMEERTIGSRSYFEQTFWISQPSLAGLPTVVAPVGHTAAGLPAAVQIIGPMHEDDTAITFAELLAELTGAYQPPPL